jgi:hypothetical protein
MTKNEWETFVDFRLMRERETFNRAILSLDHLADQRGCCGYTALGSLICALMSLLDGRMYAIRFGTMRALVRPTFASTIVTN